MNKRNGKLERIIYLRSALVGAGTEGDPGNNGLNVVGEGGAAKRAACKEEEEEEGRVRCAKSCHRRAFFLWGGGGGGRKGKV